MHHIGIVDVGSQLSSSINEGGRGLLKLLKSRVSCAEADVLFWRVPL